MHNAGRNTVVVMFVCVKILIALTSHGQPWPTMARRGLPLLTIAGHSQFCPDLASLNGHGQSWPAIARLDVVDVVDGFHLCYPILVLKPPD